MNLNLEKREVTIILNALSTQPYSEVAALIRKIVDQTAQPEAPGQCNTEECYYCPFPCERHKTNENGGG